MPDWLRSLFHWLGQILKPVGRLLRWIGRFMPDAPYARILLWALLIGLASWLLWLLYLHFFPRHDPPKKRREAMRIEDDVLPEAASARRWLQEADALAAEGRYAEAVHHLLIRSIDDIGKRRPQLIRPALTSRDLAAAREIPFNPRRSFADIAAVVERSLFGGRAVDIDDWTACRTAYDDFARAREWRR